MRSLSLQSKIITGVAFAIALLVFGFCMRRDWMEKGAVSEKLRANSVLVKQNRAAAVVAQKAADIEVVNSDTARAHFHAARSKVEVRGDSVFADGQSLELPSVAALVRVADVTVAQDSTTIKTSVDNSAAKDSLVASIGTTVDLLQEYKKPRIGLKTGIAIGVVSTAVVVVIAVKILKAVGHR